MDGGIHQQKVQYTSHYDYALHAVLSNIIFSNIFYFIAIRGTLLAFLYSFKIYLYFPVVTEKLTNPSVKLT